MVWDVNRLPFLLATSSTDPTSKLKRSRSNPGILSTQLAKLASVQP